MNQTVFAHNGFPKVGIRPIIDGRRRGVRKYADRVFDCHLRNVSDPKNGSSGAPAHAGKIDYLLVFRAMKAIGYSRWCGLELANAFLEPSETNPGANLYWIPQSLGYFRALAELA